MTTDCHCHILPGLDDGAQTLEESVFLAGKLEGWGYRRAVCTSRSTFKYRNTPATVTAACDRLLPWEGNHILIELPIHDPTKIGDVVPLDEVRRLLDDGYQPVLAHPERYLYLQMEDCKAFKEAGCQLQRNVGTLEGMYGETVRYRAEALDAQGMYDWIGTDLHSRNYADFFDRYVFADQGFQPPSTNAGLR